MTLTFSVAGFGELAAALGLFFASHSLPALPGLRARLTGWCGGERRYLLLHSLIASATLIWLVAAALRAPYLALWDFHAWTRWVPILVMPFACMLLVAGLTTSNPFSLGRGGRGFDPQRLGILAITRHPVLWAAALWSGAHLFPNGSLRAVLLFGTLCGFSLIGTRLFDHRRAQAMGAVAWVAVTAGTSNLPFAAFPSARARLGGVAALALRVVLGAVLYVLLLAAHGPSIGKYPLYMFN
jgi:uncharacterized membrane protein